MLLSMPGNCIAAPAVAVPDPIAVRWRHADRESTQRGFWTPSNG